MLAFWWTLFKGSLQTLIDYNFAQGLAIYTRFDYFNLIWRSQVCQNHTWQIVLDSCSPYFHGAWFLHTLKRSSKICLVRLVCILTNTIVLILHLTVSHLSTCSSRYLVRTCTLSARRVMFVQVTFGSLSYCIVNMSCLFRSVWGPCTGYCVVSVFSCLFRSVWSSWIRLPAPPQHLQAWPQDLRLWWGPGPDDCCCFHQG